MLSNCFSERNTLSRAMGTVTVHSICFSVSLSLRMFNFFFFFCVLFTIIDPYTRIHLVYIYGTTTNRLLLSTKRRPSIHTSVQAECIVNCMYKILVEGNDISRLSSRSHTSFIYTHSINVVRVARHTQNCFI